MNKIVLGLILGGILGILDGLTSWFTPAVRSGIVGIVIGSTFKGIIAGILIGVFARKVNSLALGIVFGLAVGAFLAWIIALHAAWLLFPDHAARRHGWPDRRAMPHRNTEQQACRSAPRPSIYQLRENHPGPQSAACPGGSRAHSFPANQ